MNVAFDYRTTEEREAENSYAFANAGGEKRFLRQPMNG